MGAIFGHLNLADSERVFKATVGQAVIYEAATDYINRINEELNRAMAVFVARTTDQFKLRYKLPGGGYLQRRDEHGRYGGVKASGYWDVAFKLEDFGAMIVGTDVAMAYMTVGELEQHINTVVAQNINTVRFEILKALMNEDAETWVDPIHGSLTIQPLANGDSVIYPPVVGSMVETTEQHYIETGYATSSISDVNDPFVTVCEELQEHVSGVTNGSNIVTFINSTAQAKTEALTKFVEVEDAFIRSGSNTAIPVNLPAVPGNIIGRHKAGTWVSVWDFIPDTYMLGVHLEWEAPLTKRVDPEDTGLGQDLQLVAVDERFPFQEAIWRHRFGLGVSNRLNGVALELAVGSDYSTPSEFA